MTGFRAGMRAFVYLYVAITMGMFCAGLAAFGLGTVQGLRAQSLPGDGGVLWLVASAFIAGALIFERWDRFGRGLQPLRWTLLCIVATLLGGVGLVLGLLTAI